MSTPAEDTASREDSDTPVATSSAIQLARDADLLIRTYLPSSGPIQQQPHTGPPIPLPLCIPQTSLSPSDHSTFARGYNDALNSIGIAQELFLNFLDGLNMAIVASPPLRVVELTGRVIAFIPYHWAMIAGAVMSTTAGVAIHVLSKTLTDRFLRAANLNLFKPRGLSVRICTTAAMLALVNASESGARSKLNKFGRGVGSVLLRLPLPVINPIASSIIHAISDKPPSIRPSGREGDPINNPVLQRRVAMTQEIALPLKMNDLPPPAKPKGVMDRMNSWGVKFDTATDNYFESNTERRRRAYENIKQAGIEPPWRSRRTVNDLRMQTEIRLEKMEQQRVASFRSLGMQAMLWPKTKTRMERKVADADLLEHWSADKTLWVVVMASERDEEIADIAIAEDPADEERIDNDSWRETMTIERDEMQLENIEEFQREQEQQDAPNEHQEKMQPMVGGGEIHDENAGAR
ncbi:hypothetical protein EV361DRAFT_796288 [Lentinula raphanica]|nr:hypothetical protein F5880DRAFT_1712127 [Lentinula raphanica]KAJ3973409.1 hypothetical protein EV361DRAFT_796288 [Lentinula raphanica]